MKNSTIIIIGLSFALGMWLMKDKHECPLLEKAEISMSDSTKEVDEEVCNLHFDITNFFSVADLEGTLTYIGTNGITFQIDLATGELLTRRVLLKWGDVIVTDAPRLVISE